MNNKQKGHNFKQLFYYMFVRKRIKLKYLFSNKVNNKFLFILSPPYCGSTLLNSLISTSKYVSSNNEIGTREGQTLPEVRHIMFGKERWNKDVEYSWDFIKKNWMKYWDQTKPILLEKSTPNIIRVQSIKKTFQNSYFICIVRNPYAQVEGIMRRNNASAEYAANFSIKCLEYQKYNIEKEKNLIFFNYEDLCDNTKQVASKIINFLPEINNLNIDTLFKAHNFKTKNKMAIKNLNKEKIEKISKKDLAIINKIFQKNIKLLKYFNYNII